VEWKRQKGINETDAFLQLPKPKRQDDGAKLNGSGIIIAETRGHVLSPEIDLVNLG
jgi:hypothetical protein